VCVCVVSRPLDDACDGVAVFVVVILAAVAFSFTTPVVAFGLVIYN